MAVHRETPRCWDVTLVEDTRLLVRAPPAASGVGGMLAHIRAQVTLLLLVLVLWPPGASPVRYQRRVRAAQWSEDLRWRGRRAECFQPQQPGTIHDAR